ncbi:HD domain-containing protein [Peptacetobacter sp.]|uniref:HD domain-containing protein n=1 Tax=Peptacetobacter sp. TaxID=2991975 RepID=UPI002639BC3C|nr:HD domain-containing protein [Peptacetobacter sp.]
MIPKRVKQFYVNLTDKFTEEDEKYAQNLLDGFEYYLFMKISNSEKKHSVRVSREFKKISEEIKLNKYSPTKDLLVEKNQTTENLKKIISKDGEEYINNFIIENEDLFIKAGLLHDVGKSKKRINIIEKSIIVILNKITSGKLKKSKNKKIQCYYRHSEYSENMLKNHIKNKNLLDLIKNHHSSQTEDLKVLLFQVIDDRN